MVIQYPAQQQKWNDSYMQFHTSGKAKGGGKGIGAFIDIATCYTSAEGLANTAEKQKNTPFSSDPTVPACCDQFTVLVWGEPQGRKSTST